MLQKILKVIKNSQKIGISFHTSPDGDSLGSSLALLQILRKLNKESYIICKESIPETFKILPYSEEITGKTMCPKEGTDCIIVLDCGNIERINADIDLKSEKYTVINIDHHLSNEKYGQLNFINSNSAAVGELVYLLLEPLNVKLDKDIAICLYTSLLTDTGSFKYPGTSKLTHEIAGELIETGIDFSEIHRSIFDNKSYNRIKLYGKVINGMELSLNEKIAFLHVKKEYIDELNLEQGDTSDVLMFGTKIGTVEVVALFKDSEEGIKVSLRSKNIVDVRKIAESYGGGGHMRAAGFISNNNIEYLKKDLRKKVESEYYEKA